MNTVLIAACFVYGVYLVSQLAYLSGGFAGILPEGYTMAEYARRGFFEMAWLCAINLGVIALSVGLIQKESKTPLPTRLLWLFLPKIPYMKAVLLLAMAIGAAVFWVDVDTQVAKYNVRAYQDGRLETVDVSHLNDLGPGALPYLLELTEDSDPEIAEMARDSLIGISYEVTDFRDWNLARAEAAGILADIRERESAEAAERLTAMLGVEVPAGEVIHRRLLDNLAEKGQTYLKLELSDAQHEAFLSAVEEGGWQELPMDLTVRALLHGGMAKAPRFWDDYSTSILPPVENGYWFFLDRHPLAEDSSDTTAFLEREDYRFTLAVYDRDMQWLHVFTMDSPE